MVTQTEDGQVQMWVGASNIVGAFNVEMMSAPLHIVTQDQDNVVRIPLPQLRHCSPVELILVRILTS